MPSVLNTNMASLYAQKSLSTAQADLATSVQRLSSGKRINSAKDDAAGFAVAEAVKATKNITDQSIQNTQDAISLVQTAEGALDVVGKMLQRALTLTTEKENASLSSAQKNSIDAEIQTLLTEIGKIHDRTEFQGGNGSIFDLGTLTFTTGDGTSTDVVIPKLSLANLNGSNGVPVTLTSGVTLTAGTTLAAAGDVIDGTATSGAQILLDNQFNSNGTTKFAVGQLFESSTGIVLGRIAKVEASGTIADGVLLTLEPGITTLNGKAGTKSVDPGNLSITSNSADFMAAVQVNLENRASLGATQNQLNYIVDNMQTLSNNLADSMSRIVDTNYAAETANLTRGQILQQAATSMLAQANQMPNVILTLLK